MTIKQIKNLLDQVKLQPFEVEYMNQDLKSTFTDVFMRQNLRRRFHLPSIYEPAGKNEKLREFRRDTFTVDPSEKSLRFRAEGN